MTTKSVKDSLVVLHQIMRPEHTNRMGNVHGGIIMKMVDEAAGICAMRHARRQAVTVAIDSMTFHSTVYVGDLVMFKAKLNWVGRSSMEVEVQVIAENLISGECIHTNSAYLVYVALDDDGRPVEVPRLILETEAERQAWAEAERRQQQRLERQRIQEKEACQ